MTPNPKRVAVLALVEGRGVAMSSMSGDWSASQHASLLFGWSLRRILFA